MNKAGKRFPVGYHEFNENKAFNFQLNRWYSTGCARFEDMKEAGRKISSLIEEFIEAVLKCTFSEIPMGKARAGYYFTRQEVKNELNEEIQSCRIFNTV